MRSVHEIPHTCLLQVLDARDPLRYRSEDLESYSVQLHPTKGSVLLLNKADLLPGLTTLMRPPWSMSSGLPRLALIASQLKVRL